jgi:hypothetical protein
MTTKVLKRQFITDTEGNPIGIILPLTEYELVEPILAQYETSLATDKLAQMEKAVQDPLFMADLQDTMMAFSEADAEWWESTS